MTLALSAERPTRMVIATHIWHYLICIEQSISLIVANISPFFSQLFG